MKEEIKELKIVLDLDGVITANPPVFSWLTWHFKKNENRTTIYIITWRFGSNLRKDETIADLKFFGIKYDFLIMAPDHFKNAREAADWKIEKIKEVEANIWFDDEIKAYERDYDINLDKLLPNTIKIWI